MTEDDARHGSWAGYQLGCRLTCCGDAARNYQKRRLYDAFKGQPRTVSNLGVQRRVEALACLGWSGHDIARRLGHSREWMRQVCNATYVYRTTHDRIVAVYEEWSMRLPPTDTTTQRAMVARTRRRAERLRFAPPLAWDDIDNDPEPQWGGTDTDIDPVVVMRLLEGRRVTSTKAEKEAAMTRWVADGAGSKAELARMHGWKKGRYSTPLRLVEGGAA